MRYSFSAELLRVLPPDTTFGNAWESLCFGLLAAEHGLQGLQRLNAPDSGIDILRRPTNTAFQCKSDERGSFGSLSAAESIKSLKAAVHAWPAITWQCYTYATNANYTGDAINSILAEAAVLGITKEKIECLIRGSSFLQEKAYRSTLAGHQKGGLDWGAHRKRCNGSSASTTNGTGTGSCRITRF